jgi:hypothetical protein
VAAAVDPEEAVAAKQEMEAIEAPDPVSWVARNLRPGDLPLFVGIEAARVAVAQVPALLASRFLVAQAPRAEALLRRTQPVMGPVVTGRSLKPRPA